MQLQTHIYWCANMCVTIFAYCWYTCIYLYTSVHIDIASYEWNIMCVLRGHEVTTLYIIHCLYVCHQDREWYRDKIECAHVRKQLCVDIWVLWYPCTYHKCMQYTQYTHGMFISLHACYEFSSYLASMGPSFQAKPGRSGSVAQWHAGNWFEDLHLGHPWPMLVQENSYPFSVKSNLDLENHTSMSFTSICRKFCCVNIWKCGCQVFQEGIPEFLTWVQFCLVALTNMFHFVFYTQEKNMCVLRCVVDDAQMVAYTLHFYFLSSKHINL